MRRLTKTCCGAADRPLFGQCRDEAGDADAGRLAEQLDQIGPLAQHLVDPVAQRRRRRTLHDAAPGRDQRHADVEVAERDLRHEARDLRRLRGIRLEELAARRQVVEQVADLDARPLGSGDFARRGRRSAIDPDLRAGQAAPGPGPQHEAGHRGDRGQRLAAKAERADGGEIVGRGDLRGGVALQRKHGVVRRHADAVVLDAHHRLAAQLDGDRDVTRPGIDGVLDQLLDHRGRPLDDLAGGDLVGHLRRQLADQRDGDGHRYLDRLKYHSIRPTMAIMMPTIHQNCRPSPPGNAGKRDVHPEHAGQHGERQENRRDDGQRLHHLVQAIRRERQVRVEQRRDPVVEHRRLVGEADQVIVDVTEPVGQRLGDLGELAPRQPADDVALGRDHPAQRRHVALEPEDHADVVGIRLVEHRVLELVEAGLELLDLGAIVVDHRVDDAVQQRRRPFGQHEVVARADVAQVRQRAREVVVHGHQELLAEEDVDLVRREAMLRGREVDAVQDQVEVVAVALDLGGLDLLERVLDGELVESERLGEDARFLFGRALQIDPDEVAALRQQPLGLDGLGVPGLPAVRNVDREHRGHGP